MSRSYRKNWILTDNYGSKYKKWAKKQANKRVRKTKEIQSGRWFRKIYEPWDICDYKIHYNEGCFKRKEDATWVTGSGNQNGFLLTPFWRYRNK